MMETARVAHARAAFEGAELGGLRMANALQMGAGMTTELVKRAELIAGQSHADYNAADGLRATVIKEGRVSMLHMRHLATEGRKSTATMTWGNVLHAAVLEPEIVLGEIAVWENRKQGNAWKDFAEENADKWIIKGEQRDNLLIATQAVHANSFAHQLIADTTHEASLYWHDDGYGNGKARTDGIKTNGKMLVELKTTTIKTPYSFLNNAAKLGYHMQLGWYVEGMRHVFDRDPDAVYMIVCQQEKPFDVCVYEVPAGVIKQGNMNAVKIARRYHACCAGNSFPGVADGKILPYDIPDYMKDEPTVDFGDGGE